MRTRFQFLLGVSATCLAVSVLAAPGAANSQPLVANTPATPVGGQISPGPIGGVWQSAPQLNNYLPAPLQPLGGGAAAGGPGGTMDLAPYAYYDSPFFFGAPGSTLAGNGVGGMAGTTRNSVIVAGGNTINVPGATIQAGVGGSNRSVIVAGGNAFSPPGGTISPTGVGGKISPANNGGVIVAGGSNATTAHVSGSSVIVSGSNGNNQ